MFRTFLNDRGNDVELCGMFLGQIDTVHTTPPRQLKLVELPNRAPDPRETYAVHADDVVTALRVHGACYDDVVGFWHTHPHPSDPGPSQEDWDSIMLGAKHWWHAVWHPETGTTTWYDYAENMIEIKDGR